MKPAHFPALLERFFTDRLIRQRQASIRSALDPTLQLAVDLPDHQPLPGQPLLTEPLGTREASPSTGDMSPSTAAPPPAAAPAGPPEWLVEQLGPRPEERIARERWEREAQRLKALQGGRSQPRPAAQPAKPSPPPSTRPSGPAAPRQGPPKPGGPTIGR